MRAILFVFLFFAFNSASSQNFSKIRGRVYDEDTKQALPFVNIVCKDCNTGTSTNEAGEFEVSTKKIPVQLKFTFIGYDRKELYIEQSTNFFEITLKPGSILLSEVVVSGKKDENYVKDLVLDAYNRTRDQSKYKGFAKAFYRQTTRNDSAYSEVYEIFFNAQVSTRGIDQWQPVEGRYAISNDLREKRYVYTLNFTFLSETFSLIGEANGTPFLAPSSRYSLKKYSLFISKIIEANGRRIAIVDFRPLAHIKQPALAGKLWIDQDSHDILRMKAELRDPKCRLIEVSGPKSRWSDYKREYDIGFKTIKDTLLVPDYFKVEHSMDYTIRNKFNRKITTKSAITFYEYKVYPNCWTALGEK